MAKAAQTVEETQDKQKKTDSKKQVQSVEFSEAAQSSRGGLGSQFDILLDMDVPVTVVIGQIEIPVRRLLQLGPGSVLKLGKPIDEPADLYLKDSRFATGDVVVVDGRFAVKIRQIVGLSDSGFDAEEA